MHRKKHLEKNPVANFFTVIVLLVVIVVAMFPVLWGLTTALKPDGEISSFPPTMIPTEVNFNNFYKVLFQSNFGTYFLNSIMVTGIGIVVSTLVAAHAAYAIAKFNIRFKNQIMFFILMTSMIPPVAMLVPLYMLSVQTGLYNTHFLLILIYTAWRTPVLTWILRGFFIKTPKEIEEAGIIDGCSKPMAFYRLILPISQPGIVAAALLSAVYVWNDFLVSFTFTTKDELRMLSVGLYQYISQYGIQWGQLMAAVVISIVPIIILFICLQSKFVDGLAAGAVKG